MSAATPARHLLSHKDIADVPEDGNRYEIVDGVLYVTPPPAYRHQEAATQLLVTLAEHVRRTGDGKVFMAGLKVVIEDRTVVIPDIVYVTREQMSQMRDDGFYGPPALAVEVTSSRPERDRQVKFHRYERAGILHYWIVDPAERRLSAYHLNSDRYDLVSELAGDEVFAPETFPGLVIPLKSLWG